MTASDGRRRLAALSLFLYLVASTLFVVPHGIRLIHRDWYTPERTDFGVFYAAGGLTRDSRKELLYRTGRLPLSFPDAYKRAPSNFFNPPLLALFYSPLTAFGIVSAFRVLVFAMGLCAVLLAAL